jgi:AraC family transcriptional regulator
MTHLARPSYIGGCKTSASGTRNIVLTGETTHCHVPRGADPISLKTACYGQVEWRLEGRRYLIQPDTLLLLPDGDEYALTIDSARPSRGFNVMFRRGLVEECMRSAVSKPDRLLDAPYDLEPLQFRRRLESADSALGQGLETVARAVAANVSADTMDWLFESLGAQVAACICEQRRERARLNAIRPETRREIHRRLELAREAVEDDLAAPWQLAMMARAAMMAPHHFHRSFRETYGETPRAWLSRRRMERALALLRSTKRSITDICLSVGYSSTSSFSTAFVDRFGVQPSRAVGLRRALEPW